MLGWSADARAQSTDRTGERSDADTLARGGELYQRWCAVCHATDGAGGRDGPSLLGLDLAYIDLTMRTGRMPFPAPERGVRDHDLDDDEREAVNAYLMELLQIPDDRPDPPEMTSAARGQELYTIHCAACHGATGNGGISGGGATVPGVHGLDRITLASATRVGPFQMPAFDEEVIDEQELGDVVGYILAMTDLSGRTPLGLNELNRVTAAAAGVVLVVALVYLAYRLGSWRQPVRTEDMLPDRDGPRSGDRRSGVHEDGPRSGDRRSGVHEDGPRSGDRRSGVHEDGPRSGDRRSGVHDVPGEGAGG